MKSLNKLPGSSDQGRWASTFTVAAVVIFVISGWAWWHVVRSNPERTFYSAIDNSLRTTGMSRQVTQESGPQKLQQDAYLSQGAQHVARSTSTIDQTGDVNATIKTESIGTPTTDYVRYVQIDTTQKNAAGQSLDFSSLLNIWGKAEPAQGMTAGDLYNESTLGVVPVANLNAKKRESLLKLIRDQNVYQIDNQKIQRAIEGGRPFYTYEVSVKPEAYVTMLKQFASDMKLTHLETIDPSQYKDGEPIVFKIKVDVWSQRFVEIQYQMGSRVEKYGSFGVNRGVTIPETTIPTEELQAKLQSIQ